MSAADLATPEKRDRLAACAFRLAVDGEMVPMCQVNAGGVRDAVYARRTPAAEDPVPLAGRTRSAPPSGAPIAAAGSISPS